MALSQASYFNPAVNDYGTDLNIGGSLSLYTMLMPQLQSEVEFTYRNTMLLEGLVESKALGPGVMYYDWFHFGKIGSEYHEAGEELLGTDIEQARRRIYLDTRPRRAHVVIDAIEEMLANDGKRREIANEMAYELRNQTEQEIFKMIVMAAREPAQGEFLGGGINQNGGAIVSASLANQNETGAEALLAAIDQAVVAWDVANIPDDGSRVAVVKPGVWWALRKLPNMGVFVSGAEFNERTQLPYPFLGSPESRQPGLHLTQGSAPLDYILYKGVKIYRSNNVVSADRTADRFRAIDCTKTEGVLFHRKSVAFVKKMDINVKDEYSLRHDNTLIVASTLIGGGAYRREGAIELRSEVLS